MNIGCVHRRDGAQYLRTTSLAWCVLVMLLSGAVAINFEIAPGREECFFEEVHEGTNIKGAYAVTQGSHMDIDVVIHNPRGQVIYNAKRDGEGKFSMKADTDGTFKFCFSNKMSTISHKTVKLLLQTGDPLDLSKLAKKESMDNVERWIVSIAHTVKMIDFHQQEYRMLHERHLKTVQGINKKVKMWSFLEILGVLMMSGAQVMFVKRMFNKHSGVKRMV